MNKPRRPWWLDHKIESNASPVTLGVRQNGGLGCRPTVFFEEFGVGLDVRPVAVLVVVAVGVGEGLKDVGVELNK